MGLVTRQKVDFSKGIFFTSRINILLYFYTDIFGR